jgi:hypothetical protein
MAMTPSFVIVLLLIFDWVLVLFQAAEDLSLHHLLLGIGRTYRVLQLNLINVWFSMHCCWKKNCDPLSEGVVINFQSTLLTEIQKVNCLGHKILPSPCRVGGELSDSRVRFSTICTTNIWRTSTGSTWSGPAESAGLHTLEKILPTRQSLLSLTIFWNATLQISQKY